MLTDLIHRIETAPGNDRALFEEAFAVCFPEPDLAANRDYCEWRWKRSEFREKLTAQAWESAVRMLLPEGCLSMSKTLWDDASKPLEQIAGYAIVDRYLRDEDGLPLWKENFVSLANTEANAFASTCLKAKEQSNG